MPGLADSLPEWSKDWLWWKRGIIYQIYPRSFQDTNADGCGDLKGIYDHLDYLVWLGVDAVWISPFYPSPMLDFGYDISDYTGIHPLFGTMDDFETLLDAAHARDLKVILDLVCNHTSDRHPWFKESAAGADARHNLRRNWYIWSDPAPDGGVPNNWLSEFGGSAWQWHESGQYYYHAFLPEQPDLNWRNPEVREAIYAVMRFWLDKGVDGFRVDVMWHMIKDRQLRNNPPNAAYNPDMDSPYDRLLPVFSIDQPEVHDVVREMRKVVDAYPDRVLIGEIYLPVEKLVLYYGDEQAEAHLPFNFQLIDVPWKAEFIAEVVDVYESSLPADAWPNWVLGNHDKPRLASRVGRDQERIAAMLLLTLRGTPTLYYGDETGMVDAIIPPERLLDPRELNCPGRRLGRDPQRSPMQWDASQYAGFSSVEPWLPLGPDHKIRNVEVQQADPDSLLSLYQRLIRFRRQEPALAVGDYKPLGAEPPLLAYQRRYENRVWLIVLNFSNQTRSYTPLPGYQMREVVLATQVASEGVRIVDPCVSLSPFEGMIIQLDQVPPDTSSTMDPV